MTSVAVLVGSLRKDSRTRKMARALRGIMPAPLTLELVEIRDLALYDADLEAAPPQPWLEFRDRIRRSDAVLYVTPEYNRSIPGALKNAIDVGSRPYGQSVWEGKPAAIISLSPGRIGGFGANHHLRQTNVFLDMPTLQAPEMYIGGSDTLFDADDNLTSDEVRGLLVKFGDAFADWIERNARPR
jgi:chromate reductase, NAD(P)H dehydrogenase (quinone)